MIATAQHDIDGAYAAAQCVVEVHRDLADFLRAGQTLAEIDRFAAESLSKLDCKSAFLRYQMRGYPPFPSHACLSVNECVVHGTHIMNDDPIKSGDILKIDIGVLHNGWVGDAAWTYAIDGTTDEALSLMRCGRKSLFKGIAAMQAGKPLIDWAKAVQDYVEGECGYHLIRGLGGHGYGRKLHGPPFVSNVVPTQPREWPDAWATFKPGMLLAVEPMVAIGTGDTKSGERQWPIHTADGSLAVHYEADVLITVDGPRDLTEGLDQLPDIVGL